MAALDEILAFLDDLLDPAAFSDYGPNGLQVPGAEHVETVVTGVSAGTRLFEQAAAANADLVLVHHGLFWSGPPRPLDRPARRRLQLLFDHDMSLAAYHLPLDAHPAHGNNALLAGALGCERWTPFAQIGVVGHLPSEGITPAELVERARHATGGRKPIAFTTGPDRVRTVGIVSGGGSSYLADAIDAGLDAFLTGEPVERVMNQAQEAGIHFLAAGHYATETHGVRRLGALLAERFAVEHLWVDVPNPI